MSTVTTSRILSGDLKDTETFGEKLGRQLRGGEVIELISDLGGGKTTLVRGIAKGAGSLDIVASPTFMISKIYKCTNFDIHHYDFYRLSEPGIMEYEMNDILGDPKAVIITEWSDMLKHVLPTERMVISISKTGENTRELVCSYPTKLKYLLG